MDGSLHGWTFGGCARKRAAPKACSPDLAAHVLRLLSPTQHRQTTQGQKGNRSWLRNGGRHGVTAKTRHREASDTVVAIRQVGGGKGRPSSTVISPHRQRARLPRADLE